MPYLAAISEGFLGRWVVGGCSLLGRTYGVVLNSGLAAIQSRMCSAVVRVPWENLSPAFFIAQILLVEMPTAFATCTWLYSFGILGCVVVITRIGLVCREVLQE